ncbi:MAG: hypothetical protein Kow0096_11400 [Thiohalomonadaceae bacterium]
MNVFILNTGRCGSTTFIAACRHIGNYSAGHESRVQLLGAARLAYPPHHIEADNRLSWLLGRLDAAYGDNAYYVHLTRDRAKVVASFVRRADFGIMKAYRAGILLHDATQHAAREAIADDYVATVEANITHFLKDKRHKMNFCLENAKDDFRRFWHWIGAQGDLAAALAEWDLRHNASST